MGMSAGLLLAIYGLKVQEWCQKDMWSSAQLPESCKGPLVPGFRDSRGSPITLGLCPDFFSM